VRLAESALPVAAVHLLAALGFVRGARQDAASTDERRANQDHGGN